MNRSWAQVVRDTLNLPVVRELRRLTNRYRPRFEQLEDRWTPSTIFTVNSPLDDPLGSTTPGVYTLRDAINAVNADVADSATSPDVIKFAIPGTSTISLTADLPAVLRPVNIDGSTQGAGGVTILGSDNHGNVYSALDAESAVSLNSVTISGGTLTVGAGSALSVVGNFNLGDSAVVMNSGSLQVSGSVVAGSNVGIYDYDQSALDVTGDFTMDFGGYVYNGADFTSSDSATFVVGGSLRIGDNGFFENVGDSAVSIGNDLAIGDAGFIFNGISDADSATLTVGGSVSLGVSGGNTAYVRNNGVSFFQVAGDFTLLGESSYVFNGTNAGDAATFQVSGTFALPGNSGAVYNYGNGTFAVGGLQLGAEGNFYNHSDLSVNGSAATDTSTLHLFAGGSLDVAAGGDFTVDSGGAILADSGTRLTIEGDLTIDAGGTVSVDLLTLSDEALIDIFGSLAANTEVIEGNAQAIVETGGNASSQLTIRITPYSVTYDGTAHQATGTAIAATGQDLSGLLSFRRTDHVNAGSYADDTWTFVGNSVYGGVSGSIDDEIAKADQTITVTKAAPSTAAYGTSFTVSATASSGLGVAIVASGVGTGSGTNSASVSMTSGTGSASITFSQAGNDNYNAATVVVENVTAQKADQTITVTQAAPTTATYGTSFLVSATASSGLGVDIAAGGVGVGSGTGSASISMTSGTGSASVTFSQAGNDNYNAATVVENVTAQKADQTITVTQAAPTTATYGTSFLVSATASSGLGVDIAAGGVGVGSGAGSASISMTSGTGSASVTFSQAGNDNYNAATVVENVTAQKADQTITVTQAAPTTATYGTSFLVSATASTGLGVDIAAGDVGVGSGSGSASISMTSGTGSASVTFSQAGNDNYNAATVVENVTAQKADQTITVTQAAPTTATYGTSFLVSATASSGLDVGIVAGGVGAGSGTDSASISMTSGTGSASVTFSQAGNSNYNAATVVVENVTAQKANQTITVTQAAPASATSGATFSVSATSSSGLAVSIAATGALSGSGVGTATITVGTSGSGTVTFSQLGDANFNAATSVVETTTVASTTRSSGGQDHRSDESEQSSSFRSRRDGASTRRIEIDRRTIGRSNTGSTGVKVTAILDGKRVTTTFNQSFATIYITGSAGNDNIELASTLTIAAVVHLGNGNNDLQLGNGNNTVTLGNGNNRIEAGNGTNLVTIGSAGVGGNNVVALGNGSRNVVTIAGNGNNSVQIGKGDSDTVTILGKGRNSVLIGDGKHDVVTLGDGTSVFRIGGLEWFLHLGAGKRKHACHG